MIPKICLFCEYFYFYRGEPGYSEMTPEVELSMGCGERVWEFNRYGDDLHECMMNAQTCKYFTLDNWAKKRYNLKEE